LIVRVGVDDDIGTPHQRFPQTCAETFRQSAMAPKGKNRGATGPRDVGSVVLAAIIDHQDLDFFYARDVPRQFCNGGGEGTFFVVAGDLDYQLHRVSNSRTFGVFWHQTDDILP